MAQIISWFGYNPQENPVLDPSFFDPYLQPKTNPGSDAAAVNGARASKHLDPLESEQSTTTVKNNDFQMKVN